MWIYILLPTLIMYGLILQRLVVVKPSRDILIEQYNAIPNKVILGAWFLLLLLLGVYKGTTVGTDSSMYYRFYLYNSYHEFEPVIALFYEVARQFDNYLLFQLLIYVVFLCFMFKGIKKHCPNYLIGLLFFVLTFIYYSSFNQYRQIIVVSLVFYFVHYLIANKIDKLKFILIGILAMTFHASAILLLVFLLIPQKRISLKFVIPLFIATIILYFIPTFKNAIGEVLVGFSDFYRDKYDDNLQFFFQINKEKGLLQLLPVLIQMILIVSSYFYSNNHVTNNKLYFLSTNILIINLTLYAVSGIEAIDRMQLYFSVFNIYFYSIYIHQLLNNKNKYKGIIIATMIILFWVFYYALRLFNNNHGIVPYSFFS